LSYSLADVKSVLHGASDDESVPNTYDYDDSFIDDGRRPRAGRARTQRSRDDDESAADSDEEEDVRRLVKEAKGFVKNDKLAQKT